MSPLDGVAVRSAIGLSELGGGMAPRSAALFLSTQTHLWQFEAFDFDRVKRASSRPAMLPCVAREYDDHLMRRLD